MTSLQAGTRTYRAVVTLLLVMAAVLVAQSFGRFTWNFVLPSARDGLLDGSNTWAGLLGTLNLAAYLAGALAVATAATRLSLGALARIGLVLATAGLGLASVAGSPFMLAVALVVMGAGGAAVWIPAPALAAGVMPESRRGLAAGLLVSAIGAGAVLIGRVPSLIGDEAAADLWRRVYQLEFAAALAVSVTVLALLRGGGERGRGMAGPGGIGGVGALRTMPGWLALTVVYASFGFSYMLAGAYLIARVRDDAGFTVEQASLVFSVQGVASIAGGLVLGPLSDRFGPRRVLMGVFALASGATLLVLAAHPAVVVLAVVILAGTSIGTPAVVSSYVLERAPGPAYGSAFGAVTLAFGAAQMAAPQVGGVLADATGSFTAVFVLSALARLVGLLAAARLPASTPRRAAEEEPAPAIGLSPGVPGAAASIAPSGLIEGRGPTEHTSLDGRH